VNVTEEPEQVGLFPEVMEILTEGVTVLITFIVIPAEVTIAGLAHPKEEVMVQVTISPLAKLSLANVEEFAEGTGFPLIFH
jgi:hypothetical protein